MVNEKELKELVERYNKSGKGKSSIENDPELICVHFSNRPSFLPQKVSMGFVTFAEMARKIQK